MARLVGVGLGEFGQIDKLCKDISQAVSFF